jgi:hypothetical protein
MSVARAAVRVGVLRRHLNAVALREELLFPKCEVYVEEVPTTFWGYTIQMNVRHDEKIIDFVTESLSQNDKMEVYLRQKKMMRDMYPHYIITEKHA